MKYLVLFVFLLFIIFLFTIYFLRKRYTREKFAFHAFASLVTFATVTIIPILVGHSFFSIIEDLLRSNFSISIISTSTIYDKFLSVFIFLSLIWLANKLHANWEGPVSERTYINKRRGIKTGLFIDALAQGKSISNKTPLKLHEEQEYSYSKLVVESQSSYDRKRRIANTLMAYSDQFKIKIDTEWHPDFSCYITEYGKNRVMTMIHCPYDNPDEKSIKLALEYAKNIGYELQMLIVVTRLKSNLSEDIIGADLSEVKIYSEAEILDKLSLLQDYSEFVIDHFENKKLSTNSNLTLSDIYVASSGLGDEDTEINSIEDYIIDWIDSDENYHMALLGEYGQGKSTLSYKLAYDYFTKSKNINRIPIVLELRGKSPRTMSIEELLFSWSHKYGLNHNILLSLHEAGRILLILEGFDEMDFVGDTEIRLSHFRSLWQFAIFPKAKIIITGRPNFFFDTKELKRALLLNESADSGPRCKALRIAPFKNEQVGEAVRNFPKTIQKSLLDSLNRQDNSEEFIDLLSRPSTLFWAADIWEELLPQVKSKNILSASVIGLFLLQSYDRQKNKQLNTTILAVEREFFTLGVAIAMHKESPGSNQISAIRLRSIIEKLIDSVPEALQDFTAATESHYVPFPERIKDPNRRLETVLTDVRTCGIIVEDISRPGYFRFAHKSFYEYLVSLFFAYSYLNNINDKQLVEDLSNDKNSISVKVITQLFPSTGQSEILLSFLYHEISQFTGQIFIEKIQLYKNISSPKKIYDYLLPGSKGILTCFINFILEKPFSSFVKYLILMPLLPAVTVISLRQKVWLSACKGINVPSEEIDAIIGKRLQGMLTEEAEPDNFFEKRIAVLFGNFNR